MKTIFDKNIREELINRIEKVDKHKQPQWGKMTIDQMLLHNTYWNEWILGNSDFTYKQTFLGKLFGKFVLKRLTRDEKPFDKNIPTSEQFKPKALNIDLELETKKWIYLINEYEHFNNPKFIHDFFGKMTKEQIGILAYKHTDHHLRQFGL
jgi:hypothetical protein